MAEDKFDILKVKSLFEKSLEGFQDNDDVELAHYLDAYREIFKFFQLMGTIFGFVSSDLKSKIDILLEHKQKSDNFTSVKVMMDYEMNSELLNKKDYVSGSRTLLRLHRGLDFLRNFLRRMGDLSPEENTYNSCYEAYDKTLAKFHPWIIRKSATLAMNLLPTREQLLNKVCCEPKEACESLPSMLEVTDQVYDRVQELYSKNNLLELP